MIKFNQTTKVKAEDLAQVPFNEGQLLFIVDTKQLMYDYVRPSDSAQLRLTLGGEDLVAGLGIDITNNTISLEQPIFVGTAEEWEDLDDDVKAQYVIVNITDDGMGDGAYTAGDGINISASNEISVVNRLVIASALPAAASSLEGQIRLLTGEQTGYIKGGIYECQSDGETPPTYSWTLISSSAAVDAVEEDNMNPVTSNAVYEALDALGTAAEKDATDRVQPNNHDLVESTAVYSAINNALSSIYTPRGDISYETLIADKDTLLTAAHVGDIYELSSSGTTTDDFLQGVGTTINVGDNVGIIQTAPNVYKFNLMANAFDLTDYQKQVLTTALIIGGVSKTTVEAALAALNSVKVDKSATAGLLKNDGTVDTTSYAETVSGATNGNFAALNADGNLVDSGKKASDFAEPSDIPGAYSSTPAMNGAASAGSAAEWSRGDHVHPTDTTRQPKTLETPLTIDGASKTTVEAALAALNSGKASTASPVFTGTPTAPTAAAGTDTDQVATTSFVKKATDALPSTAIFASPRMHANIYRGKYLGTSVTAEQYAAISAGTFDDLYVSDYWTIGGVNWRIADFDYWYGKDDTACSTHHVVIVPDTALVSAKMNNTNTTGSDPGGYVGSDFYTGANSNTGRATAIAAVNNAFGAAHVMTKRLLFTNKVANGIATAGNWYDSKVDLMNEINVYGSYIFTPAPNGSTIPYNYTTDYTQFALFRLEPQRICNRAAWWLRDVVSAANFAGVFGYGYADCSGASHSLGVRPAFAIKG